MKNRPKSKYSRPPRRPGRFGVKDPLTSIPTYVPNSFYLELEAEAARRGVPVNRLLLGAAMNAAKGDGSFDINISMPPNPDSTIGLYKEEEAVLFRWISRNQSGISIDLMVACQDDIGIPDRAILMYAFYSLLKAGQIETFEVDNQKIPKVKVTSIEKLTRRERFHKFAGEKPEQIVHTVNTVVDKKTGISSL